MYYLLYERARAKGLGLGLAFEADFEFLSSMFTIAVDASGGGLRCLLELRITLILSLAQRSYRQSRKFLKTTYLRAFRRLKLINQAPVNQPGRLSISAEHIYMFIVN